MFLRLIFQVNIGTEKQWKNGLAFFQVVAIMTNLSTVFRAQKYIFFEKKKIVSLREI
jgi:hypothetical protein